MVALNQVSRVLVLGAGVTGLSVARFMVSRGYQVRLADSRQNPPCVEDIRALGRTVQVFTGEFDGALLEGIDYVVCNPGIAPETAILVQARSVGLTVVGDIELFAQHCTSPVVAVTGTNGKSTVVAMLESMNAHSAQRIVVGGNIGYAALDLLQQPFDLAVLELSSFQLETTYSLAPVAASVLNLSPDHMDRYPSVALYAEAKRRIYRAASTAVIMQDDPVCAPGPTASTAVQQLSATYDKNAEYCLQQRAGQHWLCVRGEAVFCLDDMPVQGEHNRRNALFAWALATCAGIERKAIERGLCSFQGLPHRSRKVAEFRSVAYINDSKGTNVGATVAALAASDKPAVLIAGGDGKGQDFSPLQPVLAKHARALVTIGRDGEALAASAAGEVPAVHAENLLQAVIAASEFAQQGDRVLFSPACASFDMFANFQARGEAFEQAVKAFMQERGG